VKRCTKCILPETFPGIRLDEDQVCQFCRQMPSPERRAEQRRRLADRFEWLADHARRQPGYHCVMSWGGGRDSTYTLHILRRRYNLRILAFTLDNGFLAPSVFKNTRRVAEHLDVDHIVIKPRFEVVRRVFVASAEADLHPPRALERGSGICNSCTALIRGIGLRLALEHRAAMLAYGWLPGQIPLASAFYSSSKPMLRAMVHCSVRRLAAAAGDEVARYFPEERQLETAEPPVSVAPLLLLPYEPTIVEREIRAVGWERPEDPHTKTATCLLHRYANQLHLVQKGFHPDVMELAAMVREGFVERDAALQQLNDAPAHPIMRAVAVKLGRADRVEYRARNSTAGRSPIVSDERWLTQTQASSDESK
jgi:hypothetical protein